MKPNRSNSLALLIFAALFGGPLGAQAQDGTSLRVVIGDDEEDPTPTLLNSRGGRSVSEGAEFLLLPIGARAVGMGGAVTGLRGTGELVMWNPAGVAGLEKTRLLFNHSEGAFDTRSEVLAVLWPTGSLGTLAATYFLVDYGELASTNVEGAVQGTINFRNQEFLLSYATRLIGSLEAGINYKIIQLIFRCDGVCAEHGSFTRTTHAVDLGLLYDRPAGLPVTVGGAIRHLGFALQGANEDDPLPTRVRMGVAYRPLTSFTSDSTFVLALALDVEDEWRDLGRPDLMVGSELGFSNQFFLRGGYSFLNSGLGGPALGLGLTYDWFYLDLSRGFDDLSTAAGEEATQVTFGVIF